MRDDLRGAVAAACLSLSPAAVSAQDCAPEVVLGDPAGGTVSVRLDLPCAHYAPVAVTLGPLSFSEETSVRGGLDLTVPLWPGAPTLSLAWEGGAERVDLPAPPPGTSAVAVVWPGGAVAGRLTLTGNGASGVLGFPAPGTDRVAFAVLAEGDVATLTLPVDAPFCGRAVRAVYLRDAAPVRAIDVTLPACRGAAGAVRLTLPE